MAGCMCVLGAATVLWTGSTNFCSQRKIYFLNQRLVVVDRSYQYRINTLFCYILSISKNSLLRYILFLRKLFNCKIPLCTNCQKINGKVSTQNC